MGADRENHSKQDLSFAFSVSFAASVAAWFPVCISLFPHAPHTRVAGHGLPCLRRFWWREGRLIL
jgi:hypothetical protein